MILSLAPMEGITGHAFRRVHAECFGALDCYYTPFLPPPRVGNRFGGKAFKEIDPANNQGLNVVPQLMSKNADEFVWAAQVLADMGYREVNLNLGCPSGTVVAKGKGSGFLRNLDELEVFLGDVCERSPLPVSIKTAAAGSADKKMTAKAMLFSEAIVRGSDITKAAALASPLFSSLTIEFLIVGESSGALATMLKEAALLLEQDFTASLKNFKVLLEPVLLIIISLVIGAMIFTVASPLLTFLTEIPEYE